MVAQARPHQRVCPRFEHRHVEEANYVSIREALDTLAIRRATVRSAARHQPEAGCVADDRLGVGEQGGEIDAHIAGEQVVRLTSQLPFRRNVFSPGRTR
jgi:hypothetical protein